MFTSIVLVLVCVVLGTLAPRCGTWWLATQWLGKVADVGNGSGRPSWAPGGAPGSEASSLIAPGTNREDPDACPALVDGDERAGFEFCRVLADGRNHEGTEVVRSDVMCPRLDDAGAARA